MAIKQTLYKLSSEKIGLETSLRSVKEEEPTYVHTYMYTSTRSSLRLREKALLFWY